MQRDNIPRNAYAGAGCISPTVLNCTAKINHWAEFFFHFNFELSGTTLYNLGKLQDLMGLPVCNYMTDMIRSGNGGGYLYLGWISWWALSWRTGPSIMGAGNVAQRGASTQNRYPEVSWLLVRLRHIPYILGVERELPPLSFTIDSIRQNTPNNYLILGPFPRLSSGS